ncbi:MAG: hypothetical protein QM758_02565 [Armatimonas sp.]
MDTLDKNKKRPTPDRGGAVDPQVKDLGSEDEIEEEIDRDIDESFPASDPPGWVLGSESGYGSKHAEAPKPKPTAEKNK